MPPASRMPILRMDDAACIPMEANQEADKPTIKVGCDEPGQDER